MERVTVQHAVGLEAVSQPVQMSLQSCFLEVLFLFASANADAHTGEAELCSLQINGAGLCKARAMVYYDAGVQLVRYCESDCEESTPVFLRWERPGLMAPAFTRGPRLACTARRRLGCKYFMFTVTCTVLELHLLVCGNQRHPREPLTTRF